MTIDYTGSYFRRDGLGGAYIGGICPLPSEEPTTDNLEVDHQYFDDKLWPRLANRVPAFNSIKVRCLLYLQIKFSQKTDWSVLKIISQLPNLHFKIALIYT